MKALSSLLFVFAVIIFASVVGQSQTQPQTDGQKVYLSSEVDQKLVFKEKVKAPYTDQARRSGINGYVLLRGIFRPNGKIENIEVVKGLGGGLNESAIKAMKKIKFLPAKKDGKDVSVSQTVEYHFNLIKKINIKR